jgi:hypothetical protein
MPKSSISVFFETVDDDDDVYLYRLQTRVLKFLHIEQLERHSSDLRNSNVRKGEFLIRFKIKVFLVDRSQCEMVRT